MNKTINGPWAVEKPYGEPGVFVTCANPRTTNPLICKMLGENVDNNARLVAVAPDMFSLLEDIELALKNGGLKKPLQWETAISKLLDRVR